MIRGAKTPKGAKAKACDNRSGRRRKREAAIQEEAELSAATMKQ